MTKKYGRNAARMAAFLCAVEVAKVHYTEPNDKIYKLFIMFFSTTLKKNMLTEGGSATTRLSTDTVILK